MKLTDKQREDVVELLRCGADRGWLSDAGEDLGVLSYPNLLNDRIYLTAWECAWFRMNELGYAADGTEENRRARYLEAAQLVEEGVLP